MQFPYFPYFPHFVRPTRLIQRMAVLALLAHVSVPLWAVEPQPLSLGEAQQIAAARSPQIVAQEAVARAARDMAVSAGQLPDPVLKLGIDNLPVSGADRLSVSRDFMTMRRIGIMQELPREEKRRLKAERFGHDADRAQAQRQLALAGLQRDTALAWLERYYSEAQQTLLQQQTQETRLQVQAADIAFRAGRGTQADVLAARAALVMLEDRISQTDRQARNASLTLARWVGADADRPLPAGSFGPVVWQNTSPGTLLSLDHLKQHPQLTILAAQREAAESEARLAQANTQSDWTVEAAYQHRGPSFSNMISLGVSVPLQWDQKNRQNREMGARLALVEEAKANYEDMLRAHESEVRTMLNDWQSGKARVARYGRELLPLAAQRTEAALTAYRIGKSDLGTALTARRDEIDTRIQAITLELETARLWAQLNYLIPDSAADKHNALTPSLSPHDTPASAKGQP